MAEEHAYLEPGFDPSSLTVPKLRSILVAHEVSYPSSAKKSELVELFNSHVASQAKRLRDAQNSIRRSSKGIVNVSPGGNAIDGRAQELEDDDVPPLETPARKSSRKAGRASTEEVIAATPRTSRSTRQSTAPPPAARGQPRISDAMDGASDPLTVPRARTSRRTTAVPQTEEKSTHSEQADSPFTQDNPFQSGSPPPTTRSKSGTRRKSTLGVLPDDDRRKSREGRRRTEGFTSTNGAVTTTKNARNTLSATVKVESESDSDMQAGEEFTADQQLELDQALSGKRTVARRPKKERSSATKAAPLSILVALLGGIATVWRQEKLKVGYCGIGEPSVAIGGVEIPEWANDVRPQCEPCPQHAICYENFHTICEPGFILRNHPLSFNGLVPLPLTCEPDAEKTKQRAAVAEKAVEELREVKAKAECGEIKSSVVPLDDLKTVVASKRRKSMSDEEFEALWESAEPEILGRDEVTSKSDGSRILLSSSSLARVPLLCAIRRSLRAAVGKHLFKILGLILLSLSAVYGKHSLTVRNSTLSRARILAGSAMEKLALQASLHAEDGVTYQEPYVSMVALRDDVLREEFNAKERSRLWEVVKKLVESNANVRSMVREGRTGEVSRVWEWIGPLQRLESPEGRRGSTRYSLGTGQAQGKITGPSTPSAGYTTDQGGDRSERSRWTEGNSSYF